MIDDDRAVRIVDAPPSLSDVGPLDGLDARHEWPPLLLPGVLMDVESYASWESHAIALLTRSDLNARAALAHLRAATARLTSWSPGDVPLAAAVDRELGTDPERVPSGSDPTTSLIGPNRDSHAPALKRWLAARLFGCWIAYQGRGLLSVIESVERCLSLFESEYARDCHAREAIRRSDFQILHTP